MSLFRRYPATVALLLFGLSAGCSGGLELRFGEELCNDDVACPSGRICVNGVCVVGEDRNSTRGDDLPEWAGADGEQPDPEDLARCRVDAQCAVGEMCFDGQCIADSCNGFLCPTGTVCRPRCRALPGSCDGVECTDNVTHCLNGECVPLCTLDPCDSDGCIPGSEGCIANPSAGVGEPAYICDTVQGLDCDASGCVNAEVASSCVLGRCEPVAAPACDSRACGPGSECVVECLPPDPCDPNPCNSGWRCQDLGDAGYTCIPLLCSGISCPEGEVCINGNCQDPCANLDCADGGQLGCGDNQTCCARECCPDHFVCRQGNCELPDFTCNPQCEDDEFCTPTGCLCGAAALGELEACGNQQCCLDPNLSDANTDERGCLDPCAGNPCAGEELNRGCQIDCTEPLGFVCVDLCEGVSCEAPDSCDLSTGQCSCGGVSCDPDECCINDSCSDVCAGADCAGLGQCTPQCGAGVPYQCVDQCSSSCPGNNPDCNPEVGVCTCFAEGATCGANSCCTGAGCENPCAADPCGGLACVVDCAEANNYRCENLCPGGDAACASIPRNPNCDPASGQCTCNLMDTCNSSECCVGGVCDAPCDPDPCAGGGTSGTTFECVRDCTVGDGYRCDNYCDGVTCNKAGTACDPIDGLCKCSDALGSPGGQCLGSTVCCVGDQCVDPCAGDPCSAGPGGNFRCVRDCNQTDGFRCEDFCTGVNCSGKPNRACDPTDGQCKCLGFSPGDPACTSGSACCTGDVSGTMVCDNPCSPNPCASSADPSYADTRFPEDWTRCRRDCDNTDQDGNGTDDGGYVWGYYCQDRCASVTCTVAGASCDPDQGRCECTDGSVCTGAESCCLGGTCTNPCDGNPCGGSGTCEVNCAAPGGFECIDQCVAQAQVCGTQPNPDCYPVNASCRCGENNTWDTCGASECCLSHACDNPCSPNPCVSGDDRVCSRNCDVAGGYECSNFCDGVTCSKPNTVCDPIDQRCECGGAPCGGTNTCCVNDSCVDPCAGDPCGDTGQCVRDCSQTDGFRCEDQCAVNACGVQPNPACYPPTGACRCGAGTTWDDCSGAAGECCIDDACLDPCNGNPCSGNTLEKRCTADCDSAQGFACDDACAPTNSCEDRTDNPVCDNATGDCYCQPNGASCSGGQICCDINGLGTANQCRTPLSETCPPGCANDPCFGCVPVQEGDPTCN